MFVQTLRSATRTPAYRSLGQTATINRTAAISARSYAKYNGPPFNKRPEGEPQQPLSKSDTPQDQTWKADSPIKFAKDISSPRTSGAADAQTLESSSKQTGEFNKQATPSANTVPDGQPGPNPETVNPSDPTPHNPSASVEASEKETGEFNTQADPSANTVPDGQPGPQSSGTAAKEAETEFDEKPPSGPLPDLRQGIPSTFAKEFGLGGKPDAEGQPEQSDAGAGAEGAGAYSSGRARRRTEDEEFDQSDYETSTDRARARLARYMYASLLLGLGSGAVYFGRPYEQDEEKPSGLDASDLSGWGPGAIWSRIKGRLTGSVEYYTEPTSRKLLPEMPEGQRIPYTLVLSLEDLLIHSEWSREHGWRTAKRPGVDYFLRYLTQYFELVVFTTVPYGMGEPVIRKLDPFRIIMWPLFREATKFENGKYIKDLAYLNRPLEKTLIIDTNASAVSNQPDNAIILPKWTGKPQDGNAKDLVALIPFLEYVAATNTPDVRKVIKSFEGTDIPQEFARREALQREEFTKRTGSAHGAKPRPSLGGLISSSLGMKPQPAPGMLVDGQGQTVAEGLSQGKMLSDQIRERGQAEYLRMEEMIRQNGDKWLKDMEDEEKKAMETSMKDMKKGWFGSFAGGPGDAKK